MRERRFEKVEGFVLVHDIVASSGPLLDWPEALQIRFLNEVLVDYSDTLAEVVQQFQADCEPDTIPFVHSTGDGLKIVARDVQVGVHLCWRLQEAADQYAPIIQDWIGSEERDLGISPVDNPFAFSAGIGMTKGLLLEDRAGRRSGENQLLSTFAGQAFVLATRISSKARIGKAVLSPLLDHPVVEAYQRDTASEGSMIFFKVGEYPTNTKGNKETMLLDAENTSLETRELFSVIDESSPLVPVALSLGEAVEHLYDGHYQASGVQLHEAKTKFEGLSTAVIGNQIVRRRWATALNYIERKVQMSGYLR